MHGEARSAGRESIRYTAAFLAIAVVIATLIATLSAPAGADTAGTPPPEAVVLVDAGTGRVITARNMHTAIPPASTAKIMTALVAAERLPPDATVPVSANAANREAMKIGMQTGTKWSFDDTMASLMLVSANDAAYALAEAVGGSVKGFASDLNATARRYGMKDSTFGDPAGLTDGTSYEGGPKVSAYDLAIATRNALAVPEIAQWENTKTYDFTDPTGLHHTLENHNKFLPGNTYGYEGADGFKTGYTEAAQHALVATAKRGNRQCIAVILGSSDSGYTWAASLLDKCWQKPAVAMTSTRLPPVRVSPYATRAAAKADFTAASVGKTASASGKTPATISAGTKRRIDAEVAAATSPIAATHKKPGFLSHFNLIWWFLLLAVIAFFLRRNAVKRQRARRIARQRARAKAMRSGSLPVVDGKYRTGTRVGQPVESAVRVARSAIDLTELERAELEGRNPSD